MRPDIEYFISEVKKSPYMHVQKLDGYKKQKVCAFSIKYKMLCVAYIFECRYGIGFGQIKNGKMEHVNQIKTRSEIKKTARKCRKSIEENTMYHKSVLSYVMDEEFTEFLYGLLVGDGGLAKTSKWSAYYYHSCKFKRPLIRIQKIFENNGIIGKIKAINGGYSFKTCSYTYLLDIYNKWYLSKFYICPLCEVLLSDSEYNLIDFEGVNIHRKCPICGVSLSKKIIPTNFSITPNILKWWYYGDGSFSDRVSLCVCGFLRTQNILLTRLLNDAIKINATYNKNGNIIYICKKDDIRKFFKYIGECDISCYKYKWPKDVVA